ncbi:hypothetical protein MPTK1_1g11390 [Marchantia polymorpha subsp. ruderalis]|uniref:Uncharacterized protein n=2 Tax=Marchantia polymorpha TaxID=3197 RepID=A0AAF6AP01_MARPO|nr:hypothetical protein MARPO_0014s0087 [Marchantia polymorpha]BBM98171.1 hypothetical protein Mp_1g11390 [Marchantia polymorpha subsp. ruderalis]|eukprot:PTQ45552.1 hypothetical protein MARPO_0014s0087 [Marchantia polymorpha]
MHSSDRYDVRPDVVGRPAGNGPQMHGMPWRRSLSRRRAGERGGDRDRGRGDGGLPGDERSGARKWAASGAPMESGGCNDQSSASAEEDILSGGPTSGSLSLSLPLENVPSVAKFEEEASMEWR